MQDGNADADGRLLILYGNCTQPCGSQRRDVVVMLSAESFMRDYLGQGQLEGAAQLARMKGNGVCGIVLVLYYVVLLV